MMKRILAATAALASVAALASPAFADAPAPAVGSTSVIHITINGAVDALCSIQTSPGNDDIVNLNTKLQNPDGTLNTNALSVLSFSLGEVWCNGSTSTVFVDATPIKLVGTAPTFDATKFADSIDYTVSDTAGEFPSDDTYGKADAQVTKTVGIFDVASDTLNMTPDKSNTLKLVAGAYQGVVVIDVTPGV